MSKEAACLILSTHRFSQKNKNNNNNYNIVSRAAQSNSVYVSVLKIPIVQADSVSKSLRQKIFSRELPLSENIIFRGSNGYKHRRGSPVPKGRQFSDLVSWARVLKWGRKREKQRKRRLGIKAVITCDHTLHRKLAPSLFALLSESETQQIRSGKTKQMTI